MSWVVPRRWVVNASPLIILGKINQLPLLSKLTESLVVPAGVAYEIEVGPESDPARQWLAGLGKDHVREIGELDPLIARWDLGRGESHVLTWALRHPGCEAIIDDLAARKCAAGLSIPVCGTLGVILHAKTEGHLRAVAPVLDQIRQAGMHLDHAVLRALLRLAGES